MRREDLLALYAPYIGVDTHGMLSRVLSLPVDLRESVERYSAIGREISIYKVPEGIVITGMGGSFIGGLFLQDALYETSRKLIIPLRETSLPSGIDDRYLLIAVSYSGNTEETIRVVFEAHQKKIPLIAVTSGGLLAKLAEKWKIPLVEIPSGFQPRAAFPHMCAALAAIVETSGLASGLLSSLKNTASFLENNMHLILDRSDMLARWLSEQYKAGNFPIIYSYRPYLSAGYRLKTQINENAKLHAFYSEIPESNHNEIMGWEGPFKFSVVLVRTTGEPDYIYHRIEFLRELLRNRGVEHTEVQALGENHLQKLLSLFYTFDVASILLALLRGVPPAPTTTIDNLKKYLEERITFSQKIGESTVLP